MGIGDVTKPGRAHWGELKSQAFHRAENKCEKCGIRENRTRIAPVVLILHHLHYDTYGQETLADVQVLCRSCHGKAHSWWETEGKFLPEDDPVFDWLRRDPAEWAV
jgi:5-methylcytosine-specific restriction endonuclease McrA